jgi:diguanylate cyclase (GGDEF)-like protein
VADYFQCADPGMTPLKQHKDALQGISSRFEMERRTRIFDMRIEPLRTPQDRVVGCLGQALDITQRKKSDERMLYEATHDGLTGLGNYRAFFEAFEREVTRRARSGGSFALLLIDVNDLKLINDRLGHLVGNRALRRIARILKQSCRASDLAARFGGDEFAVLLIDASEILAEQVAARIDAILREDPQFPPLRVSVGISVYPQHGTSAQALFEIADKRLYHRKKYSRLPTSAEATAEFTLGPPALKGIP